MSTSAAGRRWLVPEVVQTSAMDCGPAVLKGLLEGHGIPVHFGRLREACQTEVDGTSIDVLEEVARRFGLAAEQVMVPVDHLLVPEAEALPAILVVRLPSGFTHFVLVWRRHGPLAQVMDPAVGRRWVNGRQLLDEVYVHELSLPAADWHAWAATRDFLGPLAQRLRALGLGRGAVTTAVAAAAGAEGWQPLAALDAVTRFVESLVAGSGVRRGREAAGLVRALARDEAVAAGAVPEPFRSVRAAPTSPDGEEMVRVRGAVLVRVRGRTRGPGPDASALGPELAAAVSRPDSRPLRGLARLVRSAGPVTLVVLALGLALTACGTVFEGLLLRSALDVGRDLGLVEQRLLGFAALAAFGVVLCLAEFGAVSGLMRLGRHLEARFRAAFAAKVPRLNDRYFQSRPVSDMADRCHRVHQLRSLPVLAGQAIWTGLSLVATAAALAWASPAAAPLALGAAALAIAVPCMFNPLFQSLDFRVRTHEGALGRFDLDALLGLAAVRAHGAERSVRREHESLLVEWARACGRLLRWAVIAEAVQAAVGFGLACWLVVLTSAWVPDAAGALLLAYWALSLSVLGAELARLVRQYPLRRSRILRILEPLGAPEDPGGADVAAAPARGDGPFHPDGPVGFAFESVSVRAAGHVILSDITLRVAAGNHVAVVGPSGAGKSSLLGLLLGWHRPAAGRVLVEGEPLDAARLERLRPRTAWVDPAVRLWNRSLLDNLRYGLRPDEAPEVGGVLDGAELFGVLQRLPGGLQEPLGEGGGLLSGGEGQRVRVGRAWARPRVGLAVLDEPFRGLDRKARRRLLAAARARFRGATLLCVTHDVGETLAFDRVLVVEGGRVVEDGTPSALAADPVSRFRGLLDAEEAVRAGLWAGPGWERLKVDDGRVTPEPGGDP